MNFKPLLSKAPLVVACAATVVLSGCSLNPTMTQKEADDFVTRSLTLKEGQSVAGALCDISKGVNGWSPECPRDTQLSKEKYDEFFKAPKGQDSDAGKPTLLGYGAMNLLESQLVPGYLSRFSGVGMGLLGLGSFIFSESPKPAYTGLVAFIPADKYKTKEEVEAYLKKVTSDMAQKFAEENGGKTVKTYDFDFREPIYYPGRFFDKAFVSEKDKCTTVNESGDSNCGFYHLFFDRSDTPYLTRIPSWLPNAGQPAWLFFTPHFGFLPGKSYKGPLTRANVAVKSAKYLPDNFYFIIYEGKTEEKLPPMVLSNKAAYYYVVPKK